MKSNYIPTKFHSTTPYPYILVLYLSQITPCEIFAYFVDGRGGIVRLGTV